MALGDGELSPVYVPDEGIVLVPFGFQVNGTSDPDNLKGDKLTTATRAAAGRFTLTLAVGTAPYSVVFGTASASTVANSTDVKCQVDWSTTATDRIFTVRTMAGATEIDPTDNTFVGGVLFCKTTDRAAGR